MKSPVVELSAQDLHKQGGLYCPSPAAKMNLWDTHPKVYLEITPRGQAQCPYCGTVYQLKTSGEHAVASR